MGLTDRQLPSEFIRQAIVIEGTARLEFQGVQPSIGFGHSEAGPVSARNQRRQPTLLLLIDAEIVCVMSAASLIPKFVPTYSSGMTMPRHPESARARWKSLGKPPSWFLHSQ